MSTGAEAAWEVGKQIALGVCGVVAAVLAYFLKGKFDAIDEKASIESVKDLGVKIDAKASKDEVKAIADELRTNTSATAENAKQLAVIENKIGNTADAIKGLTVEFQLLRQSIQGHGRRTTDMVDNPLHHPRVGP